MVSIADAMVISLGFDTTGLVKGQKEAGDAITRTKEAVVKSGKDIETSAKGIAENLSKATSAFLELSAAFLGARSFKDMIEGAVQANTAVGNLSTGLGTSAQDLSAWNIAAKRMGGSAGATMASIQSLSDSLVDLRTMGKAPPTELFMLGAMGKTNIDLSHGWEKLAVSMAKASSEIAKTDPAAANRLLRSVGLDPATAALLIRQGPRMQAYIDSMKRYAPSEKDAQTAERLTDAQGRLGAAWDLLSAKLMTALGPALEWIADKIAKVIEYVSKWVEEHPKLTAGIVAFVAILAGTATAAALAAVVGLAGALAGIAGLTFAGVIAALGAVGVAAAAALGVAYAAGAFDDDKKKGGTGAAAPGGGTGGNVGVPANGNDAIRMRGRLSKGGWWNADRQKHAYDTLTAGGMPEASAIALISRWKNVESTGAGPNSINGIGAEGIAQWLGARKPHTRDFDAQLGHVLEEYRTGSGDDARRGSVRASLALKAARDDAAAATGASAYERAEMYNRLTGQDAYTAKTLAGMAEVRRNVTGGGAPSIMKGQPHIGGMIGMRAGAHTSSNLNNISNDYRATTSSNSNEVHIQNLHVHSQASDASGISQDLHNELRKNMMFSNQANYGPS